MIIIKQNKCDDKDKYLIEYGKHFNEKLCNFATSLMETKNPDGTISKIKVQPKDKIDQLLKENNIHLNHNKYWDYIYVANMAIADFIGSSIPDEKHLALFIKDMIEDVDGKEGYIFCRWIADMKLNNIEIDWQNMI